MLWQRPHLQETHRCADGVLIPYGNKINLGSIQNEIEMSPWLCTITRHTSERLVVSLTKVLRVRFLLLVEKLSRQKLESPQRVSPTILTEDLVLEEIDSSRNTKHPGESLCTTARICCFRTCLAQDHKRKEED
jgi:hypothetical protein